MVGPESLIEAGRSLTKVAAIDLVRSRVLLADLSAAVAIRRAHPAAGSRRRAGAARSTVVLAAQAAIGALDYFWVTLPHSRSQRMARHDILEEQKETEGDPRVKRG